MKYKVVQSTGCTLNSLTINGVEYWEMPESSRNEFLDHVLDRIRGGVMRGEFHIDEIVDLLSEDDYTYSKPCGQCGDKVSTTTWNIE